jgi:hypothetical protein
MGLRLSDLLPCTAFFAVNRFGAGVLTIFMQLSLVFWPSAAKWARSLTSKSDIDRVLAHFAETHRVDPYSQPAKKFRRAA